MNHYKIIFTGPVGAGKTTAISSVSDIPVIKTDENASDMTKQRKDSTTVAMDYGAISLDGGERIHLYGTPGQERFNFMWEILTQGGLGLVLLIDNTRADPFQDMRFFLTSFDNFIAERKIAIGVTQMDIQGTPSLEDYHEHVKEFGLNPPIFEVDARKKKDVSLLLQALLYSLDPWLGE